MPRKEKTSNPPPETQYVPEDGDSQNQYEAIEILDERGHASTGQYYIKWQGIDPATKEPWKPSWEAKSGCTNALISEWKERKRTDPKLIEEFAKRAEAAKKEREEKEAKRKGNGGPSKKRKVNDGKAEGTRGSKESSSVRSSSRNPRNASEISEARSAKTVSSSVIEATRTRTFRSRGESSVRATGRPSVKVETEDDDQAEGSSPSSDVPPAPATATGGKRKRKMTVEVAVPKGKKVATATETSAKGKSKEASEAQPMERSTDQERALEELSAMDVEEDPGNQTGDAQATSREMGTETQAEDIQANATEGAEQYDLAVGTKPSHPDLPGEHAETYSPSSSRVAEPVQDTVLPPPSPSNTSGRRTKDTPPTITPRSHKKKKPLGPVPVVTPGKFRKLRARPSKKNGTQSSSASDPIVEFTSPAGTQIASNGDGQNGDGQNGEFTVDAEDDSPINLEVFAQVAKELEAAKEVAGSVDEQMVVDGDDGGVTDESLPVQVVMKIIDGEEVWMALSDGAQSDSAKEIDEDEKLVISEVDVGNGIGDIIDDIEENGAGSLARDEPSTNVDNQNLQHQVEYDDEDLALLTSPTSSNRLQDQQAAALQSLPSNSAHSQPHNAQYASALYPEPASLPVPTPYNNDLTNAIIREKDELIAQQAEKIARLAKSFQSRVEDCNFLRTQYNQASNRAVEETRRAAELDSENQKLRRQLDLGLKQKGLHFEAIKQKYEQETKKLKLQNEFLLKQSKVTDDIVRAKAATVPDLELQIREQGVYIKRKIEEHEKVMEERSILIQKLSVRAQDLTRRNDELRDEAALARAREMGAVGEEWGSDGDSDSEDEQSVRRESLGSIQKKSITLPESQISTPPSESEAVFSESESNQEPYPSTLDKSLECKWVGCHTLHKVAEIADHFLQHSQAESVPRRVD